MFTWCLVITTTWANSVEILTRLQKPVQSALYHDNTLVTYAESNCAQYLSSASNNLKVFICQSWYATCHYGIFTGNQQINYYNKVKYHSLKRSDKSLLRHLTLYIGLPSWVMLNQTTRLLCQICSKPCSPSRGHSFALIFFINFYQNVSLDVVSVKFEYGSYWVKN